jgi:hypothetical protein
MYMKLKQRVLSRQLLITAFQTHKADCGASIPAGSVCSKLALAAVQQARQRCLGSLQQCARQLPQQTLTACWTLMESCGDGKMAAAVLTVMQLTAAAAREVPSLVHPLLLLCAACSLTAVTG